MSRIKVALTAVVAALCMITLNACGESDTPSGEPLEPTINIQEANRLVDDYMERGRRAISPDARLTDDFRKDSMACDDPTDRGPKGRVFATRDAEVAGIPNASTRENFTALRTWWKENSFRVTTDNGQAIYGEHTDNGFRMSLESNDEGKIYLGVSSPCVWPDGTPEPESPA
ncbi:hypothetical protein [Amycolatopsis cihanbeyliensis]|uniref:LppA-like lipoprotein n=1 Tax=Amycolatopsis cihanbeyliensis TaxID=1128664 RepID=A0A542DM94_AMYCI|nr:hypothetical protein [Amycolatopsis cihanbeyliensis]TQJ04207.1 hypothetical protein FB471_3990 [Amycolatopsis cihanbeyliensis]